MTGASVNDRVSEAGRVVTSGKRPHFGSLPWRLACASQLKMEIGLCGRMRLCSVYVAGMLVSVVSDAFGHAGLWLCFGSTRPLVRICLSGFLDDSSQSMLFQAYGFCGQCFLFFAAVFGSKQRRSHLESCLNR